MNVVMQWRRDCSSPSPELVERMLERIREWIDDALQRAKLPASFRKRVTKEAEKYLTENCLNRSPKNLNHSGDELRQLTDGFLFESDIYRMMTEGMMEKNLSYAEALAFFFPQFIAAVALFYSMRIARPFERERAAQTFLASLRIPMMRVVVEKVGDTHMSESALDRLAKKPNLVEALIQNVIGEKPFSFANAIALATEAAKNQAIDVQRTTHEMALGRGLDNEEDAVRGLDDFAEEQGMRPGRSSESGLDDERPNNDSAPIAMPEMLDELFPVAFRVARCFPNEQLSRNGKKKDWRTIKTLLHLMLGGVHSKKQSSEPWCRLEWGLQPDIIDDVQKGTAGGENWVRDIEEIVGRLLRESGYDDAVLSAVSQARKNLLRVVDEETMPSLEDLRELDQLLDRAREGTWSDSEGWIRYVAIGEAAADQLAEQLVAPNPPAKFTQNTAAGTIAHWLFDKKFPSPPPPSKVAWAVRELMLAVP